MESEKYIPLGDKGKEPRTLESLSQLLAQYAELLYAIFMVKERTESIPGIGAQFIIKITKVGILPSGFSRIILHINLSKVPIKITI